MLLSGIALSKLLVATAAGALVGVAYALSPVTVWFCVAIVGLCAWVTHGLSGRERRWVLAVLVVPIALRVLAVVALLLARNPAGQYYTSFFFDGDGRSLKVRSIWIQYFWSGDRVDPFEASVAFSGDYGWSSYIYVLAYLQYLFGPAPYAIHLLNVALYVAGAIVLYRFVREMYGRLTALAGLMLLLCLPTLFVWSISALKESLQFFLAAVTLVSALYALTRRSWRKRLLAALVSMVALGALTTVRVGLLELVTVAVGSGVFGAVVVRRRYVSIAVALTLAIGGWYALKQEAVQASILAQLQRPVSLHMGNVRTEGHAYRLLDRRFYTSPTSAEPPSLTWPEAVRYVVRGVASFVLVPLPWDLTSTSELVFLPAQMLWYGVFLLACAGLLPGLRRHALLTLTLAAYALVGATIVSINNGNVGTLVRFRDMVVPFVAWLSVLGGVSCLLGVARWHFPRPTGSMAPAESAARPIARASILGSSLIAQWLTRITHESKLCRFVFALLARRNTSIDSGVPPDEEALVLRYFAMQARRSRLFDLPTRWLAPRMAAWREAGTVRFLHQFFSALSIPQRVQLLGWTIAVAVSIEALVARAGSAAQRPFDWGMQVTLLALAFVFMTGGETLAAAWDDWKRRSSNHQIPGAASVSREPALARGR